MTQAPLGTVLRHIRQLAEPQRARELSDAQLLESFVRRREESAFAALLQRHARLVWGVCRQVLHHEHDAEDAFQATFLVLARHAASIRRGQAVSSWLYHVAQRIAVKAGTDRARRRTHERQAAAMTHDEAGPTLAWRELQALLDAELQRLPEKYRAPFVLCCLEGKSKPEAALILGWKEGTVSGRLAQARKFLRQRLTRRGVLFTAALCATSLALEASPAPAALARRALQTALGVATNQTAAALAEGVTTTMFASKAKLVTALLLAAGLVAAGLGLLARQAQAVTPAGDPPAAKGPAPDDRPKADAAKDNKPDAIVITGRVLDPEGKPVKGAKVRFGRDVSAESDKDGAYRVSLPRAASEKGEYSRTSRYWYVVAAAAEGYGPDFREIGTAAADGTLDLHLVKDDVPVEGRILDLEGRPVAGATVRVARVSATPEEKLDVFLKAWKKGPAEAMGIAAASPAMIDPKGVINKPARPQWRRLASPDEWWGLVKPATTDKDGKFRLTGLGRERLVELTVSGPTVQQTGLKVVTRKGIDVKDLAKPDPDYFKQPGPFVRPTFLPFPALYGATFEHLVGPTKPVSGVVRDKATGKPLAGARVVARIGARDPNEIRDILAVTDEKGRYTLTGLGKADTYLIGAVPKDGSGLLPEERQLNDTEGLKPLSADFDLLRGVTLRGRLIDKASGKPAPGMVSYALLPANPRFLEAGRRGGLVGEAVLQRQSVGDDGEFRMIVFPGAGVVSAQADDRRYLSIVVSPADEKKGVSTGGLGSTGAAFVHGNAYRVIDPAEGAEPLKIDLEFLTGRTLTGSVVGPDDKPLAGATGSLAAAPQAGFGFRTPPALRFEKDSAKFTVGNVDPRRPPVLFFRHPEKNLAARLEPRGDEKEPLTARLRPGGKLTGRVLDAAGKPLAGARVDVLLVSKPVGAAQQHRFLAGTKTDKEGRFTIEAILPENELLLLVGVADKENVAGRTIHSVADLTVKAGETKDLGDVKTR